MTKRRSHNAVSLFPFLAVLVCTMGALILLLLVTTRRIRQKQAEVVAVVVVETAEDSSSPVSRVSAKKMAEAQSRLTSAELELKRAERQLVKAQEEFDSVTTERDRLQVDLATLQAAVRDQTLLNESKGADSQDQRRALLAVQAEHDAAEDDLAAAVNAVRLAESQLAEAEGIALTAEQLVVQRFSAIEMLRQKRRDNQERLVDVGTKETLIEFSGPRGTARTPIVVDIDANGFHFPSSGVRVRRQDLAGFSVNANPLLAAVLATHRVRSNDSVVSRPYVLLLVRPGGILDFYPAQRVLSDARIHFGYELLSEDEQVAVQEPVEGELEAVRMAVLEALSLRNQHLAGASDIHERIAALRAKEAVRRRQAPTGSDSARQRSFNGAHTDAADSPVVRPFPGSASPNDRDRHQELASSDRDESGDRRRNRESARPALLKEKRSIQELLNPGLDIERSLAEAVAARRLTGRGESGHALDSPADPGTPDGNSDGSYTEQELAQAPSSTVARGDALPQLETAEEKFWRVIEQQRRDHPPHSTGSPTGSATASQLSPQNSLPPVEGQPFQPVDTAEHATPSGTAQSFGGQTGTREGQQVSQPSELNLTYYEPVIVYLDPQYFTVYGGDPVPLHGETVSSILQTLLDDLDKVIKKGPELSFVRCLPSVRFVVSPGAHTLYLQVAAGLHKRGIPVSSVVSMESHVEEHSTAVGAALRSLDPDAELPPPTSQMKPVSEYRELP